VSENGLAWLENYHLRSNLMKVIGIHSFRRGVGKSTLAANLAYLQAVAGRRVILMDVNLHSPALDVFFKLNCPSEAPTLNDYLSGNSSILDPICDPIPGLPLHIIPASNRTKDMIAALRPPWNISLILDGINALAARLHPDYIVLDMAAGLHEESLLCMSACNLILQVLRADAQNYHGTAIMVDVARRLEVEPCLILNDAPNDLELPIIRDRLEQAYECQVAALFPHSDQLMALGASGGLFAAMNPDSELTHKFKALADSL